MFFLTCLSSLKHFLFLFSLLNNISFRFRLHLNNISLLFYHDWRLDFSNKLIHIVTTIRWNFAWKSTLSLSKYLYLDLRLAWDKYTAILWFRRTLIYSFLPCLSCLYNPFWLICFENCILNYLWVFFIALTKINCFLLSVPLFCLL